MIKARDSRIPLSKRVQSIKNSKNVYIIEEKEKDLEMGVVIRSSPQM